MRNEPLVWRIVAEFESAVALTVFSVLTVESRRFACSPIVAVSPLAVASTELALLKA